MKADISVVVVHRGSVADTSRALASLSWLDWPLEELEVVVVDAGRDEGIGARRLAQQHAGFQVTDPFDGGFAAASNYGARVAKGSLLAFLGADAKAEPAWVRSAADVIAGDPSIACVASKVVDWGGQRVEFAGGGLALDGQPVLIAENAVDDEWVHSSRDVLWAHRAGFVVSRRAFESVDGFDERFSSLCEDVDFCWRLWLAGERVRYEPRSAVRHRRIDEETRLGPWYRQYLLERNALFCLYKNLGSEHLETALAFALLRAARRATELGKLAPGLLDPELRHEPDVEPMLHVSKLALSATDAIDDFIRALPELEVDRARVQQSRRRSDAEIFPLFATPFSDAVEAADPLAATALLRHGLDLDRMFVGRRRVLMMTAASMVAPLDTPAMRTRHLAVQLAAEHEVIVVTLGAADQIDGPVPIRSVATGQPSVDSLRALAHWAEVIVTTPEVVGAHPWIVSTSRVVVADLHDTPPTQAGHAAELESLLLRADYILAADERHRDLWLGRIVAAKPRSVADAPELPIERIGILPSGVADESRPERRPSTSTTIVWGAPRDHDLDPDLAIRAVHELRQRHPEITLVFTSPRPDIEQITTALAVAGSHVVTTEWLTDDERRQILVDADIALLTHTGSLDACLRFGPVLREYLWAGVPVVTTSGSALATTIDTAGAGSTVPPGDFRALVAVLDSLISDDARRRSMAEAATALGSQSTWSVVVTPLKQFCREATRSRLTVGASGADTNAREATPEWRWGGVRQDLRIVSALLKEGGPRRALAQANARLRRLRGTS